MCPFGECFIECQFFPQCSETAVSTWLQTTHQAGFIKDRSVFKEEGSITRLFEWTGNFFGWKLQNSSDNTPVKSVITGTTRWRATWLGRQKIAWFQLGPGGNSITTCSQPPGQWTTWLEWQIITLTTTWSVLFTNDYLAAPSSKLKQWNMHIGSKPLSQRWKGIYELLEKQNGCKSVLLKRRWYAPLEK